MHHIVAPTQAQFFHQAQDPNQIQAYYSQQQLQGFYPFANYYNYQFYGQFQQQAHMPAALPPGVNTSCRSLYVGNLSERVVEPLLYEIFSSLGPVESCKLIKDKNTGESSGYGFVDYYDHRTAALALASFNGRLLYGMELKVNWAFANGQKEDTTQHFHIFVGDLSPEVDDKALWNAFSAFGTISDARVMFDPALNRSRGYGFVAFRKKEDAQKALVEMNGEWLGTRAIRCNWANQKGVGEDQIGPMVSGMMNVHHSANVSPMEIQNVANQSAASNLTVYVGNITPDVAEHSLRNVFSEFGTVEEIKLQTDKGFAFVRYQTHEQAAKAIVGATGRVVGMRPIKCSWGKERAPGYVPMPSIIPRTM